MPFTVHTKESAPQAAKPLLEQVEKGYGFIPNLIATMADAPPVAEAYLALQGFISKTSLSQTEQQVVMIATSIENECTYCVAAHSVIAQGKNIDAQTITALRDSSPLPDPKLEALRAFAINVINTKGDVAEQDKQRFLSAGYSPTQALEVILVVSTKILTNYIDRLAHVPLDDSFKAAEWSPQPATA
jgi:uncharacterized peroxidase-related enzyme